MTCTKCATPLVPFHDRMKCPNGHATVSHVRWAGGVWQRVPADQATDVLIDLYHTGRETCPLCGSATKQHYDGIRCPNGHVGWPENCLDGADIHSFRMAAAK